MFIFVPNEHVSSLRTRIAAGGDDCAEIVFGLGQQAKYFMDKGPWSVTFSPTGAVSGNPHDYFSIGPYWWPDENAENPETAPYIRRDGEVNPERFNYHHRQDFYAMSNAVFFLCTAGYYLDNTDYMDRAAMLVDTWFINPDTMMNPHLLYGQAIKNISIGRGIGIIELNALDRLVYALSFMEAAGQHAEMTGKFKLWLTQMLDWLLTSSHGIEESVNGNNHESWWNVHIAVYSIFLGRDEDIDKVFDNFRNRIVPMQIMPDGSMPAELKRTKSFHYSLFNLDACAAICELAWARGIDLWHYEAPGGISIEKAIDYMLPALNNIHTWTYKEISGELPSDRFALQYGSIRLGRPDFAKTNRKLARDRRPIRVQTPFGPLALLEGYSPDGADDTTSGVARGVSDEYIGK